MIHVLGSKTSGFRTSGNPEIKPKPKCLFFERHLLKTMAKRVVSHFGSKILPFSIEHHETALNNSSFLP